MPSYISICFTAAIETASLSWKYIRVPSSVCFVNNLRSKQIALAIEIEVKSNWQSCLYGFQKNLNLALKVT